MLLGLRDVHLRTGDWGEPRGLMEDGYLLRVGLAHLAAHEHELSAVLRFGILDKIVCRIVAVLRPSGEGMLGREPIADGDNCQVAFVCEKLQVSVLTGTSQRSPFVASTVALCVLCLRLQHPAAAVYVQKHSLYVALFWREYAAGYLSPGFARGYRAVLARFDDWGSW